MDEDFRSIQKRFRGGEPELREAYLRRLSRSGALNECLQIVCEAGSLTEEENSKRELLTRITDCVAPIKIYMISYYTDEVELRPILSFTSRKAALSWIASHMMERGSYFLDNDSYQDLETLFRGKRYDEMLEVGPSMGLDYMLDEIPLWGSRTQ